MGSCCGGSAPQPPNPYQTAAAQTGTNVGTAIANSYLGNVNQNTPQGSLSYDVTGSYTDPTSGQPIPRWTATQTPTAQGQEAINNQQATQVNLSQLANQQSNYLGNLLGASFNANQGNFNAGNYLAANPDVMNRAREIGADPFQFAVQHWGDFGQNEGRNIGNPAAPQMGNIDQLGFNSAQYLQQNPDVLAYAHQTGQDPEAFARLHYQQFGQQEGRAGNFYEPQTGFAEQPAAQYGYGSGGDVRSDFDPGGNITRSYGPQDNFSADRARVEEAMFQRLNPQLKIEEDRVYQRLADQGLRAGGKPYESAYDVYNRQANDARLGVIERGGVEQQRMSEMARAQASFENAAQQQGFTQAQARAMFNNQAQQQREAQLAARGAFYNAAQAQGFGQAQGRAGFYNQAQQQAFNLANARFGAQNQLRNQWLAEQYQQRAQPINEISALMTGSQVQQPSFVNTPRTQIPTTDVAGLINQNFAQQNDIYKTQQQSWNDIMGGLLGAGGNIGAAYLRSDRDVKENVVPMGTVFSDSGKKLPIYQYSYKDDPAERRHVGPMAQDVEKIKPSAVAEIDGVKHINLDRMGSVFGRGAHG